MDNETKEYVDIPGDATQPAATVAGEVVEKPARAWRPQDADVFEYKQNVRQRVRSSQAHPNAVFHKAKEPPKKELRVSEISAGERASENR